MMLANFNMSLDTTTSDNRQVHCVINSNPLLDDLSDWLVISMSKKAISTEDDFILESLAQNYAAKNHPAEIFPSENHSTNN